MSEGVKRNMDSIIQGDRSTSTHSTVFRGTGCDKFDPLSGGGVNEDGSPVRLPPITPQLTQYLLEAMKETQCVSKTNVIWDWMSETPHNPERANSASGNNDLLPCMSDISSSMPSEAAQGVSRCSSGGNSDAYSEIDRLELARHEECAAPGSHAADVPVEIWQGEWYAARNQLELDDDESLGRGPFSTVHTCRFKSEKGLVCKVLKGNRISSPSVSEAMCLCLNEV